MPDDDDESLRAFGEIADIKLHAELQTINSLAM